MPDPKISKVVGSGASVTTVGGVGVDGPSPVGTSMTNGGGGGHEPVPLTGSVMPPLPVEPDLCDPCVGREGPVLRITGATWSMVVDWSIVVDVFATRV
jgi:hypothetical protein